MTPVDEVKRRILDKVEEKDGCWVWNGATFVSGYGQLRLDGKVQRSHRVAYEVFTGELPEEDEEGNPLEVDHLCRNTLCVNPDHLEVVTHEVNMARGEHALKTHCPYGHPYDDENTYIRPDNGARECRACRKKRMREYHERNS